MKKYNKLSDIVANQLPEIIRQDYPTFVAFLQAYYKFLESQKVYRNLESLRDLDDTLDDFIGNIKNELATESANFAKNRFYLKHAKEHSVSHGSEDSYKRFFRLLYKKEVEIRYPQEQLMNISDSKWVQDQSIFVNLRNNIKVNSISIPSPTSSLMYLYYDLGITLSAPAFNVGDTITLSGFSPDNYNTSYIVREATTQYIRVDRSADQIGYSLPIKNIQIDSSRHNVTVTFAEQENIPFTLDSTISIAGVSPASYIRTAAVVTGATTSTVKFYSTSIINDNYIPSTGGTVTTVNQVITRGVINPVNDITKLSNKFINVNTIVNNISTKNKLFVNRIEVSDYGQDLYELFIKKDFYGTIKLEDTISQDGVVGTILQTPVAIKVTKAGFGFKVGQIVNIGTSQGSGLTAEITSTNINGGIEALRILTFGAGFKKDFYFKISSVTEALDRTDPGLTLTSESYLKNYVDSGVVTDVTYHSGTYVTGDYTGEILADFYDINLSQTLQDNSAVLLVKLGTVTRYPGYYESTTGLISSPDSVIQDQFYYQKFSYVLKIDETLSSYKDAVMALLHPVGRKLFAEYRIDNFYELDYTIVDPSVKLLFPQYNQIPTVASPVDFINLTTAKSISTSVSVVDTGIDAIIKDILKLFTDSVDNITDFFRWDFKPEKSSSLSTPTDSLYWTFTQLPESILPTQTETFAWDFKPQITSSLLEQIEFFRWDFKPQITSILPTQTETFAWKFDQVTTSSLSTPTELFKSEFITPISSSLSTPTDTINITYNPTLTSTILNSDSGYVFLNKYDAVNNNYFGTDTYLLPTKTF